MQALYLWRYQSFIVLFDQYLSEYCKIGEPRSCMQMACYFKKNIPIKFEQALVDGAALQQISLTALSQFYTDKANTALYDPVPPVGHVLRYAARIQRVVPRGAQPAAQGIGHHRARAPSVSSSSKAWARRMDSAGPHQFRVERQAADLEGFGYRPGRSGRSRRNCR